MCMEKIFMCTLEQLKNIFSMAILYCRISIVLDVTTEELLPFNKFLLKQLSFSNALSI